MAQVRRRGPALTARASLWALLVAPLACQPAPTGILPTAPCSDAQPTEGEVRVQPWCDDVAMTDGEGDDGDWWLANSQFKAIIRHPLTALTVPGTGGGTLIDASPWGYKDRLHEVIPLVAGGWLDVDTFDVEGDGITVGGTVVSLPDRPATALGERRVVRWVVEPDSPWLRVEGADGLWIHVAGDAVAVDGRVADDLVIYGHDGAAAEDLGGVVRADGAAALSMAPTSTGWALDGRHVRIGGSAEGADRIVLLADSEVVGWIPVSADGSFDADVPDRVDSVRAEADGFGPSAPSPPGEALSLALGGPASLALGVGWDGPRPRPVHVTWSDAAGRAGEALLPASGGTLELGEGIYDLAVNAGPATATVAPSHVELRPGETLELSVRLTGFDEGDRVLAAIGWHADRSRTWRGTDEEALREAVGRGLGFAVVAAEDDLVDAAPYPEDEPWIRTRDGASLTGPGWTITSWPWSDSPSKGGHGALTPSRLLDPIDAVAAMWGGVSTSRFTAVDAAWLAAVGPPWTVAPHPDFVKLPPVGAGGPTGGAWHEWLAWLDAGADLVPLGPLTWVEVPDRTYAGAVDVEQGLVRGAVCATTGPLVLIDVDGLGPGDAREPDTAAPGNAPAPSHVRAEVRDASGATTTLAILTEGAEVLGSWPVAGSGTATLDVEVRGRWIAAAAWSGDGATWAVTGPVWSSTP